MADNVESEVQISPATEGLSVAELADKVTAFSRQVNQLMQDKARLYQQIEKNDELISKQMNQLARKDQVISNLKQ